MAKRDPRFAETRRADARLLYEQGLSVREVATRMHLSPTRVRTLLKESGATMRSRGRPKADD